MKRFKAIIFDLDGVICHTDEFHYAAWKKMADDEGIEFDKKANERLRGVSRAQSLEIILEKADREYSDEEKQALMEKKNDLYRESLSMMTPADVSKEVLRTLHQLKKEGIKIAIGSSSKNAKFILERIGLIDFFDQISDGTNIVHTKPNPEVFLKAADMLGIDPDDCLVVEDAEAGIDAAIAGGFKNAGIGSASNYIATLYPIRKFSDILSLL